MYNQLKLSLAIRNFSMASSLASHSCTAAGEATSPLHIGQLLSAPHTYNANLFL